MQEVAISRFKETCLAVVEDVQRTGLPVRITKRGKTVAQVVPPPARKKKAKSWIGSMKGTAEIVGDIVGPIYAFGTPDERAK